MFKYKNFKRIEGIRSGRLFVIATEGKDTERIYFEALRNKIQMSQIKLEILSSENNESAPNKVYDRLTDYQNKYDIEDDDQLWLVIDKDRWTDKMLSDIAQLCNEKKSFFMGLSNPCFELWLLLHYEDVSKYTTLEKEKIKTNKKIRGTTLLKRKVRSVLGSYSEASYDAKSLIANVNDAIERASLLDVDEKQRWPQDVGTRVHKLVSNILEEFQKYDNPS